MTGYRDPTPTKAAETLREFLDERGPALARFRERLAADGQDQDTRRGVRNPVSLSRWETGPGAAQ